MLYIILLLTTPSLTETPCGFTQHFRAFLLSNNRSFDNPNLRCAEYGGKPAPHHKITKTPIIFIHGNSDIAFGRGESDGYLYWQTGFRSMADFLLNQGYTSAELYTFTWGNGDASFAQQNYHKKTVLQKIRLFIQSVLEYTGSKQVNLIAHSMGVTYTRKAVAGGSGIDEQDGRYDLGPSYSNKINKYVAIAGANLGLTACYPEPSLPACSNIDGFYPGLTSLSGPSKYLKDLVGREVQQTYVIWSKFDNIIGFDCLVYGKVTCRIPGQSGEVIKAGIEWDHFALRDKTGADVLAFIDKGIDSQ